MPKSQLNFTSPNDAWVLHREDIDTVQDGDCHIYVLLDAFSEYCLGQEVTAEIPHSSRLLEMLNAAHSKAGAWPKIILISKKDPASMVILAVCKGLKIKAKALPPKDLASIVEPFRRSFANFQSGSSLDDEHEEFSESEKVHIEAFVPDPYDPCPCASGKKFRQCCKPIFKDITFAMAAAQEGRHNEALKHMKRVENQVGLTAEVLCRYAICWSFRDPNKSEQYLKKALKVNLNHPRTNYIMGIIAKENSKFKEAIKYYQTAIDHYPPEDKFHLNEAYNNLGTAHFEDGNFKGAKEGWEKALVVFPSDDMVKANLIEFIYENPDVPEDLREVSPFIEKFLRMGSI